jgi:hypothetical protein
MLFHYTIITIDKVIQVINIGKMFGLRRLAPPPIIHSLLHSREKDKER